MVLWWHLEKVRILRFLTFLGAPRGVPGDAETWFPRILSFHWGSQIPVHEGFCLAVVVSRGHVALLGGRLGVEKSVPGPVFTFLCSSMVCWWHLEKVIFFEISDIFGCSQEGPCGRQNAVSSRFEFPLFGAL